MEYPEITILVPTYDRHKFLPLFVMNLKSQTYPADRLKLIIADDFEYGRFITDIDEFKREIHPIELTYLQTNKRIHMKPHTQTYSTKEQLEFIFPKQSYCLCSELNDEDLEEFTGFEKTFSLLKRYDWECEPIFSSH